MVENVINKDFLSFLKLDLNALECHFLCMIHGPQNCMKWMKNAFRCWNLCFHMIVWCFNPFDTIHLFLWETISPFGFGVMASIWVQTTGFGVCLWQSLNNSPGHLSNTQFNSILYYSRLTWLTTRESNFTYVPIQITWASTHPSITYPDA